MNKEEVIWRQACTRGRGQHRNSDISVSLTNDNKAGKNNTLRISILKGGRKKLEQFNYLNVSEITPNMERMYFDFSFKRHSESQNKICKRSRVTSGCLFRITSEEAAVIEKWKGGYPLQFDSSSGFYYIEKEGKTNE